MHEAMNSADNQVLCVFYCCRFWRLFNDLRRSSKSSVSQMPTPVRHWRILQIIRQVQICACDEVVFGNPQVFELRMEASPPMVGVTTDRYPAFCASREAKPPHSAAWVEVSALAAIGIWPIFDRTRTRLHSRWLLALLSLSKSPVFEEHRINILELSLRQHPSWRRSFPSHSCGTTASVDEDDCV